MTAPPPMPTPTTPVPAPATAPAPAPATGPATSPRLRNGELRYQVARLLADRPADEFTPATVARELGGRSAGAVGNALAALVTRGEATQTSTKPMRYQANAVTATVTAPTPGNPARPNTHTPRAPRAPRPPAPATPPTPAEPPAPPVPTSAAEVTGPVPRPNGQLYHPRTLSGLADVTALRKLREAGVPALLYGPPGTGKTSVVEAAFPDALTVEGNGHTEVADLVGDYGQKQPDGQYPFLDGPLVTAMREGRALFLDDATLISPTVLAVVYPAMDGRGRITITAHNSEIVTAAPGFYVIAGHNPGVHGAVLSPALRSRFAMQIEVSSDYDLADELKINPEAVTVARNLATRVANGEIGWAPQLRELTDFAKIAALLGEDTAAANMLGTAPDEDREIVAGVMRDVFAKDITPLKLGERIKTKTSS